MPMTISLCMIVRDEEDVLARCLDSVKGLVNEIVIVDTGSKDRTKEIAYRYTSRVYDFPWIDDFAAARNFAFSKARMDYTMWLDADDVILAPDRGDFLRLILGMSSDVDTVMMKYVSGTDGQGNPTLSYYRERLLKTALHPQWQGAVHEVIPPMGRILYSDVAITHQKVHPSDPDRNVRIFEKLLEKGQLLDPRQQFYYGRELYYHQRYQEAVQVLDQFLSEGLGWMENNIEACQQLSLCYNALHKPQKSLEALFRSFQFDCPRAELCCAIGHHFMEEEQYQQAIYWYEAATRCVRNDQMGGFVLPDCYDYIPYLQLCVCYDRLGQHQTANQYNEKAALIKPDDPSVQQNRIYFKHILKN